MRPARALFVVAAVLTASAAAIVACGGDDSTSQPADFGVDASVVPTDGSPSGHDASADATSEDGGAVKCPDLALGGKVVEAMYIGGSPPDETGGALVPGTYDLTGLEVYLGTPESGDPDSGPTDGLESSAQATFELTATTCILAKTFTTMGVVTPLAVTESMVSTESDVELVTAETCPGGTATQKTPFTATATTISVHTAQTRREIYTKR